MNKVKNLIGGEDKFCFEKKTNKDDIISDDNEIQYLNNFQSCFVDNLRSRRSSLNADFKLLFKKEKSQQKYHDVEFAQEKKRISILSKDLSFASYQQDNQMSILSVGTPPHSVQEHLIKCTYHNDAICLSFDDLSFLMELYGVCGKNTTALSLYFSTFTKKLSSQQNQKELNEMIQSGKFYLTFQEQIQEKQSLFFEFPKNSLGRIFDFDFFDKQTLKFYEGKSLMSLLKHYQNGQVQSFDLQQQIYQKKLKDLTYNVNLQNIYLSSNVQKFSEIRTGDKLSKNPTYKLYQSLQFLKNKIFDFQNEFKIKEIDLNQKGGEIALCYNQVQKFQFLKKNICENLLQKQFEQIVQGIDIQLCLSLDYNLKEKVKKSKNILDAFVLQKVKDCDMIITSESQKSYFPTKNGQEICSHNHFKNFFNLLKFLLKYGFIEDYITQEKHSKTLRDIIHYCIHFFTLKLNEKLKKSTQRQIKNLFQGQSLEEILEDYLSGKIQSILFPINYFHKDKGFRISCSVLNFIKLKNIFSNKQADEIEEHLSIVIKTLQKITKANSFRDKFLILKESLDKIVEIVSALTDKVIGSEELNPILTHCLLKANPVNWISNLSFMKLMIGEQEKKGEKGFALTKIEITTNILENADQRLFDCKNFSESVLKNEIQTGVHLMRKRNNSFCKIQISKFENEIFV